MQSDVKFRFYLINRIKPSSRKTSAMGGSAASKRETRLGSASEIIRFCISFPCSSTKRLSGELTKSKEFRRSNDRRIGRQQKSAATAARLCETLFRGRLGNPLPASPVPQGDTGVKLNRLFTLACRPQRSKLAISSGLPPKPVRFSKCFAMALLQRMVSVFAGLIFQNSMAGYSFFKGSLPKPCSVRKGSLKVQSRKVISAATCAGTAGSCRRLPVEKCRYRTKPGARKRLCRSTARCKRLPAVRHPPGCEPPGREY